MTDHVEHHHHAVEEKPAPGRLMSFGLFFGIAALLVGFVGALRASEPMLIIGVILAVTAVLLGLLGVALALTREGTTRGFAVVLFVSVLAIALWAVVGTQI